jgi:MoaA/NifB/PqqE/SkfB family radical SAM enzyme
MAARLSSLALHAYGDPATALRSVATVREHADRHFTPPRMVLHRGRAFGRPGRAGFPSPAADRQFEVELNRAIPFREGYDLPFALVGVTRRCGLHCVHCSEWDTLRQPDPLTEAQLREVVAALQGRGVGNIELTGGEPLLRLDAVEAIVRDARALSDFWVLTSGVPMTESCARRLADAGVTGVLVSLDHWDPARHDVFRGARGTYEHAMRALSLARDAGLLTGVSVTASRETANLDDLLAITDVARARGATYVRVLEARTSGRWREAEVRLDGAHLDAIRGLAQAAEARWPGEAPIFDDVDALRRAAGCQGAGRRFLFVDAAGDVRPCTFCDGVAGSCLDGGLDAAIDALRRGACRADAEDLIPLRERGGRRGAPARAR